MWTLDELYPQKYSNRQDGLRNRLLGQFFSTLNSPFQSICDSYHSQMAMPRQLGVLVVNESRRQRSGDAVEVYGWPCERPRFAQKLLLSHLYVTTPRFKLLVCRVNIVENTPTGGLCQCRGLGSAATLRGLNHHGLYCLEYRHRRREARYYASCMH